MTIATIKKVIFRFLTSAAPEVLALKGAWGVGKTFAWKQIVQQNKDQISLPNYCYVSLFGVASISELRITIFANTQPVSQIGRVVNAKANIDQWPGIIGAKWKKILKASSSLTKELPFGKNVSVVLESIAPLLIRNTIICFDDFERLSSDRIKPDELLGFISTLKEEKGCKVVLIFNEDELRAKDVYKKYREKVVDIELLFAPTAEEAAELAIPVNLPMRNIIKKYVVSLGIKNIRILRKIVYLSEILQKGIGANREDVMEQVVMTLVPLVWCYYDTDDNKPTFEFIVEWNQMVWGYNERGNKEDDLIRAKWAQALQDYGLQPMDELNLALCNVIERGYIEETGLLEEVNRIDARIKANELEKSFSAAWNLFHNTFADNEVELIQIMAESFKKSVRHITPINLNGTTLLLRQLGHGDLADDLIDYYLDMRTSEDKLFDLANYSFSAHITDPAIWERFNKKYSKSHALPSLSDAVKYIAINNSWSNEHILTLKQTTAEAFYNLFKLEHGENLASIVKSCLQFETQDAYESIGKRARAALVRIGNENKLNAIRVRRYGIAAEPHEDVLVPAQLD